MVLWKLILVTWFSSEMIEGIETGWKPINIKSSSNHQRTFISPREPHKMKHEPHKLRQEPHKPRKEPHKMQQQLQENTNVMESCALHKAVMDQTTFHQYIQYKPQIPDLKEFTLCAWHRFHNHSSDHPIFSYSLPKEPRTILSWVSNSTPKKTFLMLAIHGHTVYRLNYPMSMHKWFHICQSWNGKSGEWQVWVNNERIARGFYNLLVGKHIKGGGLAITGQEQVEHNGNMHIRSRGVGLCGEITLLQFYKAALTVGKAFNNHKFHHAHRFNHDGLNDEEESKYFSPATPATEEGGPTTPEDPYFENGQLKHRLPVEELLVKKESSTKAPLVVKFSIPPMKPIFYSPDPFNYLERRVDIPAVQFSLRRRYKRETSNDGRANDGINNDGKENDGKVMDGLKNDERDNNDKENAGRVIDRLTNDGRASDGMIDNDGTEYRNKNNQNQTEITLKMMNLESHKNNLRSNSNLIRKYADIIPSSDTSLLQFYEDNSENNSDSDDNSDKTPKKRMVTIEEHIRSPIEFISYNNGIANLSPYSDGIYLPASKPKNNNKNIMKQFQPSFKQRDLLTVTIEDNTPYSLQNEAQMKEKKEYEPAEWEVRKIAEMCSGCSQDPFKKANIISWQETPKKLFGGAKYVSANPSCRVF